MYLLSLHSILPRGGRLTSISRIQICLQEGISEDSQLGPGIQVLVSYRQLRELQAKIQEETFVSQTNVYQSCHRQLQAQSGELEKARKIAEGLQRECESYKHAMQGLMQQVSFINFRCFITMRPTGSEEDRALVGPGASTLQAITHRGNVIKIFSGDKVVCAGR